MKKLFTLAAMAVALGPPIYAQQPPPAPKNLKVLPANADIRATMQLFTAALGVKCDYCHVQGDFASDMNPRKETARKMIAMVKQIDTFFPSVSGAFPAGYREVDCMTCHRGNAKTEIKAAKHFQNFGDIQPGFNPPKEPATNLKVLPADTLVHGAGSIMEGFRDALGVDCTFCHGGIHPRGPGFETDVNPRKDIARKMIELTRMINTHFPNTGVYPVGARSVDCNTCHRGDPHPLSLGNKNFDPSATAK